MKHTSRFTMPRTGNEKGIVLVVAVLLLALFVIIGTAAVVQTSTDLKISKNYVLQRRAFYDAEAGVQYTLGRLKVDLGNGTINLLSYTNVPLAYAQPSGFSFDLPTQLTKLSSNRYRFAVVGHAPGKASSTINIDMTTKRLSAFDFGLFADGVADLKPSSGFYSYDSRVIPNPLPANTTNQCDIGSNTKIRVYMDTYIDGDTALGSSAAGVQGVWEETGVPIVNGEKGASIDRVNPDPLGAIGGPLAAKFTSVVTSNDNMLSTGDGRTGSVINVANGNTLTLKGKAGGADYYITSMTLKNGSTLNIDSTAGPVNIYLTGSVDISQPDLEAKTGAIINFTGKPTDFRLFSNSVQSIIFKHNTVFKGLIYAPYATVEMKNGANAYGVIWAKNADVKNSGEFYFDTALRDLYEIPAWTLKAVAWRELRD